MTRNPLPALSVALLAAALLPACSHAPPQVADSTAPAVESTPEAPPAAASAADAANVFAFRIGALDAVALKDGTIDAPNDGKTVGIGQPIEAVSALLEAARQPTDVLHLSIQPMLVRSGSRVLLFDTGAADASFAKAGNLPASLRAAGVEPAQVTDIFISHRHDDHVGGLVTRDGALAFPNAIIHMSVPEWKVMQADANAVSLVAAITPKVQAFAPGAELVSGVVTAVADDGHTPGHSAYLIESGSDRLLYIGDTAHHFVVSVQRPDWSIAFDENDALGKQRRRALLKRAADENLHVYAVHFPFPGLGHIKVQGQGFEWVPEG